MLLQRMAVLILQFQGTIDDLWYKCYHDMMNEISTTNQTIFVKKNFFLRRIDPMVGFDMQSLTAIGNPVAWLYAKPKNGGINGFTLTGGVFNYTADISFKGTGNRATLKFVFDGLDAFGYLRYIFQ